MDVTIRDGGTLERERRRYPMGQSGLAQIHGPECIVQRISENPHLSYSGCQDKDTSRHRTFPHSYSLFGLLFLLFTIQRPFFYSPIHIQAPTRPSIQFELVSGPIGTTFRFEQFCALLLFPNLPFGF